MRKILIQPLLTEKSNDIRLDQNQYTFLVDNDANKIEIEKEFKKLFNVEVVSVNVINHKGKVKSRFTKSGRIEGKTSRYKKAIIKVKNGQTLELFEQI